MNFHLVRTMLLLVVVLLLPLAGFAGERVTVRHWFDGDTAQLADGRVVRLAGIDTPEVAHGREPAQYGSIEATRLAESLTRGVPLELTMVGDGKDRYGRIIGTLRLPNGQSVAEVLVARGYAYVYWHDTLPENLIADLMTAQRKAIATRQGAWNKVLASQDKPPVGNRNSRRMFTASCPDIVKIHPRNRVVFRSLEEAFAEGFAPARNCSAWPLAQ